MQYYFYIKYLVIVINPVFLIFLNTFIELFSFYRFGPEIEFIYALMILRQHEINYSIQFFNKLLIKIITEV